MCLCPASLTPPHLQLERNSHPSLYVFILRLIARKAFGAAPPGACAAGLKSLELMKKEVFAVRVLWRKVSPLLRSWEQEKGSRFNK